MSYDDLLDHRAQSGLILSAHAWRRMSARGISPEAVHAALRYGRVVQQDGAEVFFLGRKEVRRWRGKVDLSAHQGLHVVIGRDGAVVTVYRNDTLQARAGGRR
ncbi:MAG: DUF4258 domain-containing protein [Alphaproteobacteria bacterium]|nr:DUF4258 domain-containing protein [Alphaproteobacteria bacterium]MCB9792830.1 DUF4258 domain-containing protein [Alphaproteobacteria bacterium]